MKYSLFNLPFSLNFTETLARWMLNEYGPDPMVLPRALVLVPSRRAATSLKEAFLRVRGGDPLLLPRIQPIADLGEESLLPQGLTGEGALSALATPQFTHRRQFMLTRLILRYRERVTGHAMRYDQGLLLARELAGLLDEIECAELPSGDLMQLAPEQFARHWQVTAEFLRVISEYWPAIALEEGLTSPEQSRRHVMRALAARWREAPPDHPVIAMGLAGDTPALLEWLKTIGSMPTGRLILHGLDVDSDDEYWDATGEAHPAWASRCLLKALEVPRESVPTVPQAGEPDAARLRLLAEIMRPAETIGAWQSLELDWPSALSGLETVTCPQEEAEAAAICLMLRETLETPGKTAALVTPDRALARRVSAKMQRYGITLDDSAGIPLARTPVGGFLRLMLGMLTDDRAALALLELLKHPLAHGAMDRFGWLSAARELELTLLRGLGRRMSPGELAATVRREMDTPVLADMLDMVHHAFQPLLDLRERDDATLGEYLTAHLDAARQLAGDRLLTGPESDTVFSCLADIQDALAYLDGGDPIPAEEYPDAFDALLAGSVHRREFGTHPRLKILGLIEARMQSFDRVILGGLNEGMWPPAASPDPWLGRPMRRQLGLEASDRATSQSAQDFMALAAMPEVFLTRLLKQNGTPATPSRWLVKLGVLLEKYPHSTGSGRDWNALAARLDQPLRVQPISAPAPTPPLSARPTMLSVTRIEMLMRDPYAIYAEKILGLRRLRAIAEAPGASDYGSAVHAALEQFTRRIPGVLPEDAHAVLLECGRQAFRDLLFHPAAELLWWPRFERIAAWIIAEEHQRRPLISQILTEAKGELALDGLRVTGRADRIELRADGTMSIIDYKTGSLPKTADIKAGVASQLDLLALIAQGGLIQSEYTTFERPIATLEYWKLHGGEEGGDIGSIREPDYFAQRLASVKAGLSSLIASYSRADFPYLVEPILKRAPRYNDYRHLERSQEWR